MEPSDHELEQMALSLGIKCPDDCGVGSWCTCGRIWKIAALKEMLRKQRNLPRMGFNHTLEKLRDHYDTMAGYKFGSAVEIESATDAFEQLLSTCDAKMEE